MLNRFLMSGVFVGILSVVCSMKIMDFISGDRKEINVEKKIFQKVVRSEKIEKKNENSLLSQCNSRFELLVEQYKKITLEEIREEIGKIEKEKKGDVTGSALEAVALEVLFLQWRKLDPFGFDNYQTESESGAGYYFNNPALKAKSWAELVIQVWAERDPESASQYVCERWDEINNEKFQDKPKEQDKTKNEFDFEAIMQRVAYAMGRHSSDSALEWARKTSRISPRLQYYVLQSIISNHPKKVAGVFFRIEDIEFPPNEREQCLSELVRQWRMADCETADQWLVDSSLENGAGLSDIFKREKSMDSLSGAIRYFEESDEMIKKDLKLSIIKQFAQKDPAGTLDWMLKTSKDNEIGDLMDKLTPKSEHAFQKLKKYVTEMPPGTDRWRMLRILPFSAYKGYATVDDMIVFEKLSLETNELPPKVFEEVVTSWMMMFPWKRVKQVINESSLSPELKREYIEKSPSFMDKRP